MEDQVNGLIKKTWDKLQTTSSSDRLLIAIAGIPGSGKTTLASTVAKGINDLHHDQFHKQYSLSPEKSPSQPDIASVVPLDGYHLTRKQLSEMPNAEEAFYRRGAEFTFDGKGFVRLVERLRKPIEPGTTTIKAPSFDHAVKDPVDNDIHVAPTTRVVIFEGLYIALDREPWREAAQLMDELWFVEVPMDQAVARLIKRHVASGISPDPEHARKRILESDMRNGKEVLEYRLPIQEVVKSVEDETWKSHEIKKVEHEEEQRPRTERLGSLAELAESGGGL